MNDGSASRALVALNVGFREVKSVRERLAMGAICAMQIIHHNLQPTEEWRPGVLTRMQISAVTEAAALCIFEQWVAPGSGTRTHTHPVEEVLTVLDGQAELWLDGERETVSAGQSVIVPPGSWHGFRNIGSETLHMQAILAAPSFEASFEGQAEVMIHWASTKA